MSGGIKKTCFPVPDDRHLMFPHDEGLKHDGLQTGNHENEMSEIDKTLQENAEEEEKAKP